MNMATHNTTLLFVIGTMAFLSLAAASVPVESDDEVPDNGLVMRPEENDIDYLAPLDSFNCAALRKLLLQLDADERLGARVSRSWPPAPRDMNMRAADGRLARQWRANKRQVRFRQCYFNPISCFRK